MAFWIEDRSVKPLGMLRLVEDVEHDEERDGADQPGVLAQLQAQVAGDETSAVRAGAAASAMDRLGLRPLRRDVEGARDDVALGDVASPSSSRTIAAVVHHGDAVAAADQLVVVGE